MPLIINSDDLITVELWYKEENDNLVVKDKEELGYSKEVFKFKRPNWGTLSQIMAISLVVLQNGKVATNPVVYADAKVRNLLAEWELKDSNGKKVPINSDNISKLHPMICSYLSDKMDKYVALSDIPLEQVVEQNKKE